LKRFNFQNLCTYVGDSRLCTLLSADYLDRVFPGNAITIFSLPQIETFQVY